MGGNYVAIKTIRRQSNILCQVNEINILSRLCHDNVVKMFGVLDDPDPGKIIFNNLNLKSNYLVSVLINAILKIPKSYWNI